MKKRDVVVVRAAVFGSTGDWPTLKTIAQHTGGYVAMPHDERLTMVHEAKRGPRKRNLWRYEYETPWLGMVTGRSVRKTGESVSSSGSYEDYYQGYLAADKSHSVVMVQPLHTERWLRPVACREEDMDKVDFTLRIEDGCVDMEDNYSYPEHLIDAVCEDFYTLIQHDCPEVLQASVIKEPDQIVFLAHYNGEVIVEEVEDMIGWTGRYNEVSMGGALLLLEAL